MKKNDNDSGAVEIFIAEDDNVSMRLLFSALSKRGYKVHAVSDGNEAMKQLSSPDRPQLAILDWMMPGIDGIEVVKSIRGIPDMPFLYILLLTAKERKEDIAEGLNAGADDYLTKPFDIKELDARVRVGLRTINLQNKLNAHIKELREALIKVKQLQGLLPICSYCKKIRDDNHYWQLLEEYIADHSEAKFSHSICPECYEYHVIPQLEEIDKKKKNK